VGKEKKEKEKSDGRRYRASRSIRETGSGPIKRKGEGEEKKTAAGRSEKYGGT